VSNTTRSSRLLWPSLFALVMFIVLIGLGTWQLERKTWKEGLIAALAERTSAEPVPLPTPERWSALDPMSDEFRRVTFAATIASEREVMVYGSGSSVRPDVSGPGYWAFAPAELAGGARVVVNRGFVPEGQQDPKTHMPPAGRVDLIGALRWPEPRGWFVPNEDPARNLWFARDHLAMARSKGWGNVAPFYVELETSTGPLPRAGRLTPTLRNEHLQYALTWYGLAVVLAVMFALWLRGRRRDRQSQVGQGGR
jgi:cytochrome oxidase assembly protein ShyY1